MTQIVRHTVVSPHSDDAAFSVGSLLLTEGAEAQVITICAGRPDDDSAAADWDWRCGFRTAGQAATVRRAEDSAACRSVGASVCHLSYPDAPYAPERSAADLPDELEQLLAGTTVWLPAAIGGHPDHVLTRNAVLAVLRRTALPALLYADTPYASACGWRTADDDRDDAFRWASALGGVTAQGFELSDPVWHILDHSAAAAKIKLARHYASQLCGLGQHYPGLTRVDGDLATEVHWHLRHVDGRV